MREEISNKDVNWEKLYDYYELHLREIYNSVARIQNERHFELLKNKVIKYLPDKSVFCEIGFGAGITLRNASSLFTEVIGLDISGKNVEYTHSELKKEGYNNIKLYHSDIMNKDNRFYKKFDVISLIAGLEHFSANDYPIIFENIRDYLKYGGIFTGALPYKGIFNYRMCPKCYHVFEVDGHVSSHSKLTLKNLFLEHEFEIIYLDNFNKYYNRKQRPLLRRMYKYVNHVILKKESKNQLEFIVKPMENN